MKGTRDAGLYDIHVGAEYTDEERLFILACERYVRTSGRKFPTFSEILAVAKSIGYRRSDGTPGQGSGGH